MVMPVSQEFDHSIGSEFSAGRDYFNNTLETPNMNLLDNFNMNGLANDELQ